MTASRTIVTKGQGVIVHVVVSAPDAQETLRLEDLEFEVSIEYDEAATLGRCYDDDPLEKIDLGDTTGQGDYSPPVIDYCYLSSVSLFDNEIVVVESARRPLLALEDEGMGVDYAIEVEEEE